MLYRSRAKGNYKPGSDIDLTLMGSELTPRLLTPHLLTLIVEKWVPRRDMGTRMADDGLCGLMKYSHAWWVTANSR